MRRKQVCAGVVASVFIGTAGWWTHAAWERDEAPSPAVLRGLEGVLVEVTLLPGDLEQYGLTARQVQADVKRQLRKAGLGVLSRKEGRQAPGRPCLAVDMRVSLVDIVPPQVRDTLPPPARAGIPRQVVVFTISVQLREEVYLIRDPEVKATAAVWTGQTGFGSVRMEMLQMISENVTAKVDEFINAYLAANLQKGG